MCTERLRDLGWVSLEKGHPAPRRREDEETDPWEHSCDGQGHSPSSWMASGQGAGELAEPPSYKVPNPQLDQALSNPAEL